DALDRHGVVVYRGADIGDDDLVALSHMLGEVVVVRTGEHRLPEIQTITMDPDKTSARRAAYRKGNFLWHIDGAHDPVPQRATLLAAREVDETGGGDTEFASTYAAYDALPEDEKQAIADLNVVHSFATALLRVNPDASEQERATWAQVSPRVHPLVWSRSDGRRSMLLGSTAGEVVGWTPEEGRALLDRLLAWSTQRQFVVRHQWRVGDLVVWDNTGMLHRALPFEPTSRRLLHRTTLAGTEQLV
ncbi:MAG: TauD/TfdA family dioxygenase, partial [Actinobacteria bacterium]|nr:TauD/TfdA family dioxygenase [Actinomycetota bacterium]